MVAMTTPPASHAGKRASPMCPVFYVEWDLNGETSKSIRHSATVVCIQFLLNVVALSVEIPAQLSTTLSLRVTGRYNEKKLRNKARE